MSKDSHIDETIQNLESLARTQSSALRVSKEIIALKNQLIAICEKETALYKRECKKLMTLVFWLSALLIITSILLLCNL